MGNLIATLFPFEIENKTTSIIYYEYEDLNKSRKSGEPEAKISGSLSPGEKHTNKQINVFRKFNCTIVTEDQRVNQTKQSRQVGGGDRRVSIVDNEKSLGSLRNSIAKPPMHLQGVRGLSKSVV